MRFILLLLLLTLSATGTVQAQPDLINRTVIRQDSSFLFRREDNEIVIKGFKPGNWELKADNAEITATDSPYLFIVMPNEVGPTTLRLIRNGAVALTKVFQVIHEPGIKVRWGAISADTATVTEILVNSRIVMFVPGCNCGSITVVGFNVELTTDQLPDARKLIHVDSNRLSGELAAAIRQLKHGDKVFFKEIRYNTKNSRTRSMNGPTIIIP